jgi:hypothetical protein
MSIGRIEKVGKTYYVGYDVGGEFHPARYNPTYKTRKGAERALKQRGWL